MNICISPKSFFYKNLYLIFFLFFAHIFSVVSTFDIEYTEIRGLAQFFHFDYERNIPTAYSTLALLLASFLILLIAKKRKKTNLSYLSWFWLSVIFIFLSIDEAFSIHEKLIFPIREAFGTSGFFYYGWVIPYSVILIILGAAYSKFLRELPRKVAFIFLISGAIYVLGAIGFEILGAREAVMHGKNTFLFSTFITLEELLEMLGIATFIYALLKYMVNQFGTITLTVTHKEENQK